MKNFFISSLSTLVIFALFMQPSVAQDHAAHQHETENYEQYNDVPEDFRAMFTEAVVAYIAGKDAFVDSDLETTNAEFGTFIEKLEKIGKHGLSGDGHMAWMESYAGLMEHASELIASDGIEEARSAFRQLSEELIAAVNTFGIDGVVYQQYCPMALDSDGAAWLGSNEQVQIHTPPKP